MDNLADVDAEVLIIGAGPAGLTAAYCLTRENVPVIVLEKDPIYVGGISRTVKYGEFFFDIGGHRFFSKSKEIVDIWNEILPHDFVERPRLSRIFYGRKYYSYPLSAFEALFNLGIFTSARCLFSFAYAKAFPIKNPRNFHQWVRNQFGEKLFSIFFKTYTEKVWGMSCEDISADWAAQRIKGLDLGVAIKAALKRSLFPKNYRENGASNPVVKTLIESFQYPRKGPGMMWDAAATKIQERGGKILMAREFIGLAYDSASEIWRVSALNPDGETEIYTARQIISSAPIRELLEKITPSPSSTKHGFMLNYRDFLIVALMVNAPDIIPDNWVYIHDPAVKVGRIQNFSSWSPEMVKPGTSCFGLEYFCFEGDGLWNLSDDELVALAKKEISEIGLISADDVIDACVVRQPKAYPVYDGNYRQHVSAIREDIQSNYPTLHLVGRNGMHKYNNQDHAMMTAILTARNIISGNSMYNVWEVNEDAEYHESGGAGTQSALGSERLVPSKVIPSV